MNIKYYSKVFLSRILFGRKKEMMDDISFIIKASNVNRDAFGEYKNYCEGKKNIVVCGAGPSLQEYKPIEGAIHIAVNRAFLFERVNFDFIFAQDYEGISMCLDQLKEYRPDKCVKFFGQGNEGKKMIPESFILACNAKKFCLLNGLSYGKGKFEKMLVCDIDSQPIASMMNVGMSVMQLALFMNPQKIYLAGMDHSGNHFTKANQTKKEYDEYGKRMDRNLHKRNYEHILRWNEIREFANLYYPDTEIVSVNPIGLKGIFRDVYQ